MDSGAGDLAEDCKELTQSQYVLAKYRIEQKPLGKLLAGHRNVFEVDDGEDLRLGPRAIMPNLHGGKLRCNRETCCQICWCCCVPCFSLSVCWIKCCEYCYESLGRHLTKKEEVSRMSCCTMECCRI